MTGQMSVRTFAELHDVDERTVQRWLKAGKLRGAVKTNKGWVIPADAKAPSPDGAAVAVPTRQLAVPTPAALPQATSLAGALDQLPAFLALDVAARLLGVPVARIVEDPARFEAERVDERRRLMVPARVVRQIAGL